MVKKILYLFILICLASCDYLNKGESKKIDLTEFHFPPSHETASHPFSFAFIFSESDTLINGDTLRAKIFLANRHHVYTADTLKPIIKYKFVKEFSDTSWNLIQNGIHAKVIKDTGYVKVIVREDNLRKGELVKKKWRSRVAIPLEDMDTTFLVEKEFILVGN